MSLESKLTKARDLIGQRDAIDEELSRLFNELPGRPRGRPRKEKEDIEQLHQTTLQEPAHTDAA